MTTQNNAIRTNYMKAEIDNSQQNGMRRLWGDREETVYHEINDSSKLAHK